MAGDVKLLVPLDGSTVAEHALSYVPVLQALGLTHIELLSVIDPELTSRRPEDEHPTREENLLQIYLQETADELNATTSVPVSCKVLTGAPAAVIIEEARVAQPDYLLISTHGASGLTRWRLGSVADKVVRGAECPVLAVGPAAADYGEVLGSHIMPAFMAILVPLDGSSLAEAALPHAMRFADAYGARIHLVTVASVGAIGTDGAWAGYSPQLDEDLEREARAYLMGLGDKADGLPDRAMAVRFGSPAEALTAYVRENAIDLVIMTSHGRGGVLRSALGSTTDRMLGSDAPVLVIHARES